MNDYLLLGSYFILLIGLSIFGIHRYYLAYLYFRHKKERPQAPPFESLATVPVVTVQLPIFNEQYVVPRLIDAVCRLDYPRDKLEIQVLDDSTDSTTEIAQALVERYRAEGIDIRHLHRSHRTGFKAGALNEGLQAARGDFIAIFDADFVPDRLFLKKTVPYFSLDGQIGMVQARWGHLNQDYSLLTQSQSIFLDGHFMIEHTARNRSGRFFNFNGTAGVWRRSCIAGSGGWSFDTLTEDLDLSYRAQLQGWRFLFLEDVVAPAELPVDINAFKTQQHRWAKGSIQTALKLLPVVFRSRLPLRIKVESFFHLGANLAYLLMLAVSILMPFTVYLRSRWSFEHFFLFDIPLFMTATFSITFFYLYSQKEIYGGHRWDRIKYLPLNLSLGIGLCVNNSKAVLEALFDQKGEFERTPKFAVIRRGERWRQKAYGGKLNIVTFIELALGIHFLIATLFALQNGIYLSVPFLLLFQIGYLYTSGLSFLNWHLKTHAKSLPVAPPLPAVHQIS